MAADKTQGMGAILANLIPGKKPNRSGGAEGTASPNATLRLLRGIRDDAAHVDAATRARIDAILTAFEDFRREIASGKKDAPETIPAYARVPLAETADRLNTLAFRAGELARRRSAIADALEGVNLSEIRQRQARLQMRAGSPEAQSDALIAGQFQQAAVFTQSEQAAYEAMRRDLRRIDGQLETLECAFAAMKARLLRLKTEECGGEAVWETGSASLMEEAAAVSRQMDALDDAIRETAGTATDPAVTVSRT